MGLDEEFFQIRQDCNVIKENILQEEKFLESKAFERIKDTTFIDEGYYGNIPIPPSYAELLSERLDFHKESLIERQQALVVALDFLEDLPEMIRIHIEGYKPIQSNRKTESEIDEPKLVKQKLGLYELFWSDRMNEITKALSADIEHNHLYIGEGKLEALGERARYGFRLELSLIHI